MIYLLLERVKTLVEVRGLSGSLSLLMALIAVLMSSACLASGAVALGVCPEEVPVVAVGRDQPIEIENEPDKLRVTLQHLVQAVLI